LVILSTNVISGSYEDRLFWAGDLLGSKMRKERFGTEKEGEACLITCCYY
jgi:hypothetical protein